MLKAKRKNLQINGEILGNKWNCKTKKTIEVILEKTKINIKRKTT